MIKKYLSLFVVLMLIFVLAGCKKDKTNTTEENKNEYTIAAALEAEDDEEVTAIGIVVGYGDGNYLSRGVYYIYSPEEDKAIYLYTAVDQNNLPKIGDKIKVTGVRDSYNGLPQIVNYSYEKIEEGIDVTQYYKEVTVKEILDNGEEYILKPVIIKNAVVSSTPYSGGSTYFTDSTGTIAVYRFGYIDNSNVSHGDVVDLYASVTAYDFGGTNEKLQLHSAYSSSFKTLVKVENLTDEQKVEFAKLALYYQNTNDLTEDINLPTELPTGATISWTSSNPDVISTEGKVTRGEEDQEVTLTATITSGSTSDTLEIKFTVTAEGEITIAEAREKAIDANVEVIGIITSLIGNSFFVQDETAGIYVYNSTPNDNIAVGNKVNIKGKIAEFGNAIQISSPTITKISEGNTFEAKSYDTVAKLQEDDPQGQFVEVKNLTVTNVGSGDSYSVTVKDSEGTEFIIRVDKYVNPKIESSFFNVGDEYLSVKGGLSSYKGTLQLMLSTTNDIEKANLTPQQILDKAKDRLDIANKDNITSDIALPTKDGDVTITWTSNNTDVITNDGKVTRPQPGNDDATVELTATLSLEGAEDVTKTFTVTVKAMPEEVAVATDLFFSQYMEGGGQNKVLEIYNGTGEDVVLDGYTVVVFTNGANQEGDGYANILNLTGTLKSGEVIIIAHKDAQLPEGITADYSDSGYFYGWNGDDAIVLFKDYDEDTRQGTVIDSIGKVGEDPGDGWFNEDKTVGTKDFTLIRKSNITSGDTDITDDFDPSVEWIAYPKDSFEDLGSHTME